MNKPHGLAGKPGNARKDNPANATVQIRCTAQDKQSWLCAAERKGVSLTEFITSSLNKSML